MKTNFFKKMAFLAVIVIPFSTFGQIKPLVKLGLSMSTLSQRGDLCDNNNYTASYNVGGSVLIPLGSQVDFQPEVNLIRKGRFDENTNAGITTKNIQYINYLQVPLMFRCTPNGLLGDSKSKVFLNIGPYGSLLLNAKSRVDVAGNITTTNQNDYFKKSDFGLTLGGGVQFPVKSNTFQIDLRYDLGLSRVTPVSANDYNTKALNLSIGLLF